MCYRTHINEFYIGKDSSPRLTTKNTLVANVLFVCDRLRCILRSKHGRIVFTNVFFGSVCSTPNTARNPSGYEESIVGDVKHYLPKNTSVKAVRPGLLRRIHRSLMYSSYTMDTS